MNARQTIATITGAAAIAAGSLVLQSHAPKSPHRAPAPLAIPNELMPQYVPGAITNRPVGTGTPRLPMTNVDVSFTPSALRPGAHFDILTWDTNFNGKFTNTVQGVGLVPLDGVTRHYILRIQTNRLELFYAVQQF